MRRIRFIRGMGFLEALSLGIGFIVGSGIFIIPLLAAKEAGTLSLISWLIGGIFSIFTGLCFAELAVRIPKAGGLYTYTHEAFGNFLGFLAGWIFCVAYLMMIAGETVAIGIYLNILFPTVNTKLFHLAIASLITVTFTIINYFGVKFGGRAEDFLTFVKIIPLILFILLGLPLIKRSNFFPIVPVGKQILPAIASSTVLVLWAYLGAEIITVPEEEIQKAKKTVPKAIMTSVFITNLLYLLIVFVVIGIGINGFKTLAEMGKSSFGNFVGIVLVLGGLISIIGALNAVILACARIAFAMARDNLLPAQFRQLHKKYETPYFALIIQTILALCAVFLIKDFVIIAQVSVLLVLIAYLFSCISVLKLIKKQKGNFMLFETRIIPILAVLSCGILLVLFSKLSWMISSFVVLIGLFIYFLRRNQLKPHK